MKPRVVTKTMLKRSIKTEYPEPVLAVRRREFERLIEGQDLLGLQFIALLMEVITSIDDDREVITSAILSEADHRMPWQMERAIRSALNVEAVRA